MDFKKEALNLHRKLKGKLEVNSKTKVNEKVLSLLYTPGVAQACSEIAKNRKKVFDYTIKRNSVAVLSDGSSVLGLGNIGAEAALPVMEGKAILFKELAGIDAFPICVKTQKTKEIIEFARNLSPVFGGINLEDIEAPKCFEIERKLQDLGIPVMHDDQHGTAIVVLSALLNACKVVRKDFAELRVVVNGAGAAGTAITKMLLCDGFSKKFCGAVKDVVVLDRNGSIYSGRKDLNGYKKELARVTNKEKKKGKLNEVISGADVFIGVSKGGILKTKDVLKMNKKSIVFALANPIPEIFPNEAKRGGARVVATGRSDFENQVNNVLAFPGVFRGALNARAFRISNEMKLCAAHALAFRVKKPNSRRILPTLFDKKVVNNIAKAVENCYK